LSDIEELREPVGPQYDRLLGMGSESREIHPYHEAIRAIEAARNYDELEEEFDSISIWSLSPTSTRNSILRRMNEDRFCHGPFHASSG
jgi:hypothetical protein